MGDGRFGGSVGKDFNYRVYGMGFIRGPESHPDGDPLMLENNAFGFRADWKIGDHDTFTIQGDTYRGFTGERVDIATFSPAAETTPDDKAFVCGNIVLAGSTILAAAPTFNFAYFDRTNFQDLEFW